MKVFGWMAVVALLGGVISTGYADIGKPTKAQRAGSLAAIQVMQEQAGSPLFKLPFLGNNGQVDARIKFYTLTSWGLAFVTREGEIGYSVAAEAGKSNPVHITESLLGARPLHPAGDDASGIKVSHVSKHGPNGVSRDAVFNRISIGEAYPGVQVKLQANADNVEKLFFIRPRANPGSIRIRPQGVESIAVNRAGELVLKTRAGEVAFSAPVAYQEKDGRKETVDVAYAVAGDSYGFNVGAYDRTHELIIDPVLTTTRIITAGSNSISALKIASDDSVYIHGNKSDNSISFYPESADSGIWYGPGSGAYVARISADLQTLNAITFIPGVTWTSELVLDANDNVYITGTANDTGFVVPDNGFDTTPNSRNDAFVLKLSADLSSVLGGTFFGGTANDYGYGIALAASGDVCIAGDTASRDLPITNGAYDNTWGGGIKRINRYKKYSWADGFAACFDNGLTTLKASTFIGGSNGSETARAIALDADDNVFIAGSSGSTDLPITPNSYDASYNGGASPIFGFPYGDAFVFKLNPSLTSLLGSTYLGGAAIDNGTSLAIDDNGNVYVGGDAKSSDFPLVEGGADTSGSTSSSVAESFIVQFDNNLGALQAMTYVGGGDTETLGKIVLANDDSVLASGRTYSPDFPALQGAYVGNGDSFFVKLSRDLSTFINAELVGVDSEDSLGIVAMNSTGAIVGSSYYTITSGLTQYTWTRLVKLGAVDLGISLTDSPDPLGTGDTLTYTMNVHNYGVDAATNIVVTQHLPDHVLFLSVTPDVGVCSESLGVVTCNIDRLAVNDNTAIEVQVQTLDSGAHLSTANVTARQPDTNQSNNSASSHTTVSGGVATPDLTVSMVATPDPVTQGEVLSYHVTVANNSSVDSGAVTLSDTLPDGVSFMSTSSPSCAYNVNTVSCDLGVIAAGANAVVTIDVSADTLGMQTNSVNVTSTNGDLNPADNVAAVVSNVVAPASADVSLIMTGSPGTATVNADLVYTLTVANAGPSDTTAVTVVDTLPGNADFVSADTTQGSCNFVGMEVTCNLGVLAAGASATVLVTVSPTTADVDLFNSANVTADLADPNMANNNANVITPVVSSTGRAVDLQLSMFDHQDPSIVGEALTYGITMYVNSGYSPLGTVLTVTLPPGSTYVGQGSNVSTYVNTCVHNNGVLTCPVDGLSAWSTLHYSVTIIPQTTGVITTYAEIHGNDPDPELANNTASVVTSIIASTSPADLAVSLSASAETINLGESVTYTALVSNHGTGVANNVLLTDSLPSEFSYRAASASQGSCGISSGIVSCALGTLNVGATASLEITLDSVGDGGVKNTVSVSADQSDPDTGNNSAEIEIEIK